MAKGKKKQERTNGWFMYADDPPLLKISIKAVARNWRVTGLALFAFLAIFSVFANTYPDCPNGGLMDVNFAAWAVLSFMLITPKFSGFRKKLRIESILAKILLFLLLFGARHLVYESMYAECLLTSEHVISDRCVTMLESEQDKYISTSTKENCYAEEYTRPLIRGEADIAICEEIIPDVMRSLCYGAYAYHEKDTSFCSAVYGKQPSSDFSENELREVCLYMFALSTAKNSDEPVSIDVCNEIVDSELEEMCRDKVYPYVTCEDDNGICPVGCDALNDSDCAE